METFDDLIFGLSEESLSIFWVQLGLEAMSSLQPFHAKYNAKIIPKNSSTATKVSVILLIDLKKYIICENNAYAHT